MTAHAGCTHVIALLCVSPPPHCRTYATQKIAQGKRTAARTCDGRVSRYEPVRFPNHCARHSHISAPFALSRVIPPCLCSLDTIISAIVSPTEFRRHRPPSLHGLLVHARMMWSRVSYRSSPVQLFPTAVNPSHILFPRQSLNVNVRLCSIDKCGNALVRVTPPLHRMLV